MGIMTKSKENFSGKTLVLRVTLVILILLIVFLVVFKGMGSSKENVIKEQAGIIKLRLATFIESRKRSILDITTVLSKDSRIANALEAENYNELQTILDSMQSEVFNKIIKVSDKSLDARSYVSVQVIDLNGKIVASTAAKDRHGNVSQAVGDNVSSFWAFKKMRATSGFLSSIDYDRQGIVLRALAPIVKDGRMIGVVQIVENIEDSIGGYMEANRYMYMINMAPEFNSYTKNIKGDLKFNDGLVVNYDQVEKELLDILSKAGLNKDSEYLVIENLVFIPLNLITTPATSSDTEISKGEYIATIYIAVYKQDILQQ